MKCKSVIYCIQFTWMGLARLCGRCLVTSARAPSVSLLTRTACFQFRLVRSYTRTPFARGGALFSQNDDEDIEKRIPATGWNHNKPKEDSNFWQSANGDRPAGPEQNPKEQEGSPKAARTGWLHNTESKKKRDEQPKEGGISKAQQRLQQAIMQQERNHRILSPPSFHACGSDRQIVLTEHRLSIPVYRPDRQARINLAFTIVEEVKDEATIKWFKSLGSMTSQQRAIAYVEKASLENADDMMVYLQGGPGFGSPVPVVGLSFGQDASWGAKALTKYKRIVLMDQRGTGKSTPITKQSLERRFPDLFLLDKKETSDLERLAKEYPQEHEKFEKALVEATNYMAQFRADNIVRDAEDIKDALMLQGEAGSERGPRPWGCALGQSFGGFCMMTYLSLIDHPPRICLLTGGIAPMLTPAYDAYLSLWERVRERSLQYYEMYPGDIPLIKKIVKKLIEEPAKLPSGGTLTARRFLQLGLSLGGTPSTFASMHNLFQSAFLQPDENEFTRAFLKSIDSEQSFDDHPIYFWLHESIYADGRQHSPTSWAGHRAYQDKIKTPSEFDYRLTSGLDSDARPTLFFGEMVFPWMAEDYAECGGVGCTALAEALANKDDWGALYNGEHMRQVLGESGTSRAAAAVYYDDLYVDFNCSMKVAARGGPLEKCKVYITNEYQHSGLRDDGANLFTKLHGMATGSVRTPS